MHTPSFVARVVLMEFVKLTHSVTAQTATGAKASAASEASIWSSGVQQGAPQEGQKEGP